jgi:hypothetical protein
MSTITTSATTESAQVDAPQNVTYETESDANASYVVTPHEPTPRD